MRYLPDSQGRCCSIQPIAISYCTWQSMAVQSLRVYGTYS